MEKMQELKEVREAINAGILTKNCLLRAKAALESAANYGIADMFGFDLIGGIGKHIKMNEAQSHLEDAQRQVAAFQTELNDVNRILQMRLDIDGFLSFADFFLDGLFTDFYIQSKIRNSIDQVDNGIYQIDGILEELYRMESMLL